MATIPKPEPKPLEPELREIGPQVNLAGQCFIATRGGENIKLGGVSIGIYSAVEFKRYSDEIARQRQPRVSAAIEASNRLAAIGRSAFAVEMLKTINDEARVFWGLLPEPAAVGRTDADGRFSLVHTVKSPFVLFARAQRLVGRETEYYTWLLSSDSIKNPQQVFLSNPELMR